MEANRQRHYCRCYDVNCLWSERNRLKEHLQSVCRDGRYQGDGNTPTGYLSWVKETMECV